MNMHSLHLIGAACGLGAPDVRCAEGPQRLRARLTGRGRLRNGVVWRKLVSANVAASKPFRLSLLAPFCRRLATAVSASMRARSPFVVIGGDHSCAIGTWSGARAALQSKKPRKRTNFPSSLVGESKGIGGAEDAHGALGLIWIDAHMDSHTPQTSPSGRAHGMPLACLLGFGDPSLVHLDRRRAPVLSPQHVCLIGVRSFEPSEQELLARLGVRVFEAEEVRRRGMTAVMDEALARVQAGTAGFGVSIDLDAIDPREAPAVTTPVPQGLSADDAVAAVRTAAACMQFVGLEIAEFNPHADNDGRTAALVEALIDAVSTATPPMDACVELERRYLAHNYAPLPAVLTRGKGVYVWDTAGRRYLDMMAAYSAVSFGHAHPRLVRALAKQARRLSMVSRAYFTDRLGTLAERLCELTSQERMLPMNTGAEAVETAIKAARKWAYKVKAVPEGRAEIICCAGNFHGRTTTIVGMSSEPQYREGFGPFAPGFVQIPYADSSALAGAITDNTAAFLVEPIQGEGGIIVPPSGYLRACAEICRTHDVLLLCDEVQTGLGRTGRLLACEHEGVKPDGLMLGKALGGGLLPISAFLARAELMDVFTPGDHGSTFGGNPLACAVALEALNVLVEERLVERAAELGEYFLRGLQRLRNPLVRAVRGRGLFIGIEIDASGISARRVCEMMLRHGILTKDTHETVLRFVPPLVVTRAQLDDALARIEAALAEALALAGRRRDVA